MEENPLFLLLAGIHFSSNALLSTMSVFGTITDIINESQRTGMAVSLKLFGRDPFATTVIRIVDKGDIKMAEISPVTLYGKPVNETIIHIHEIEKVAPLFVLFNDPVYVRLREVKKIIRDM
jgi:hypothetical protein